MDRHSGGPNPRVQDGILYSPSLQREKAYRVILPDEPTASTNRLSVLYLLHGYECNFTTWDINTRLRDYVRGLPILVVMPDGENSWFINSPTIKENRFEDYLVKDVVPEIDRQYRTVAEPRGRAIAGMSTGGYAAIRLGLQHPDVFSFAGSLGGTLAPDTHWHPGRAEVFGSPERVQRDGHCLFLRLAAMKQRLRTMFYLDCGAEDWWLDVTQAFAHELTLHNLAYEYHETPGGHSWEYWDQALQTMLPAVTRAIAADGAVTDHSELRTSSRFYQLLRGGSRTGEAAT